MESNELLDILVFSQAREHTDGGIFSSERIDTVDTPTAQAARRPRRSSLKPGSHAVVSVIMHFLLALGPSQILQKLPVEQVQFLQFLGAFCVLAVVKVFQENERRWRKAIGLTGTMIFQYFAILDLSSMLISLLMLGRF